MTVRVKIDELTPIHKDIILKSLFLTPTVSKYVASNFGSPDVETTIFFRRDDKYVYVPFYFGLYHLGARIDWSNAYRKAEWTMKSTFKYRQDKYDQYGTVKDAFAQLQKTRTANLNLFPGAGKTVLSACLVSALRIKTLIIFCFRTLKVQWLETFVDLTMAKAVLFEGDDLAAAEEADVVITMYSQVPKLASILSTFGCLIIDETHRMCTPDKVEALLSSTPAFVITCSATPERNNGMEKMMYLIAGTENILLKSCKPFIVFKVNVGLKFSVLLNDRRKPDWSKTLNSICHDEKRTKMIANLLIAIAASGKRVIAVCERKETLERLEVLFKEYVETYPQYNHIVTFDTYYGNKKHCEERNILLGTITKIGTAYDEARSYKSFSGKSASVLVIMSSFKDQSLLEQVVGRVRDRSTNPEIYDLVDDNTICRNHWENTKKKEEKEKGRYIWYAKNGAQIKEIKLSTFC